MSAWDVVEGLVDRLRKLCAEGYSFSQIALALNDEFGAEMSAKGFPPFTRNAALGKANRLGITSTHGGSGRPAKSAQPRPAPPPSKPKPRPKPTRDFDKETGPIKLATGDKVEQAIAERAAFGQAVVSEVESATAPAPETAKPFIETSAFECKWIVGPLDGADTLACGGPTNRPPYCDWHRSRAWVQQPKARLRA